MNDLRVRVGVMKRVAELLRPIAQFAALKNFTLTIGAYVRQRIAIDMFHRDAA